MDPVPFDTLRVSVKSLHIHCRSGVSFQLALGTRLEAESRHQSLDFVELVELE
jgi:hypothetical protein